MWQHVMLFPAFFWHLSCQKMAISKECDGLIDRLLISIGLIYIP